MDISAIFTQRKQRWDFLKKIRQGSVTENIRCKKCGSVLPDTEFECHHWICPECGAYLMVAPKDRIHMLADEGSFVEMDKNMKTKDPLQFPKYLSKVKENQKKTGNADAVITGVCEIDGQKAAIGVLDADFLMGSMGTVVGEKIARLAEHARRKSIPLIIYSASGGARMQEGLFSLMQMAKTSAAIQKFKAQGGLFISVMTNPTTGGVSASFASLGDINIAEPGALICFAGPRVIEQTIGQKLPEGFQRAEFLEEHGMIDLILERKDQKTVISKILKMHEA